jgi:hypothetical protein
MPSRPAEQFHASWPIVEKAHLFPLTKLGDLPSVNLHDHLPWISAASLAKQTPV